MHMKQKGKTRALNTGIKAARGNICAFTDDDCIPDTKWLENIVHIFRTNPMISGVFGKTLPYRPNLHPNLICPCTFNKPQKRIITKPHRHWEDIGFGNNMAFKKATLEKIGLFKTWLGPGSVGSNCEDGELAQRALIRGYSIGYNPHMIVYHNKWLTPAELDTGIIIPLRRGGVLRVFVFPGVHLCKTYCR